MRSAGRAQAFAIVAPSLILYPKAPPCNTTTRRSPLVEACYCGWALARSRSSRPGAQQLEPRHWSYSGDTGPRHSASEDPANALCGAGTRQSPIDITNPISKALSPIGFDYRPIPLTVTDTGHSMQVKCAARQRWALPLIMPLTRSCLLVTHAGAGYRSLSSHYVGSLSYYNPNRYYYRSYYAYPRLRRCNHHC